MSEKITDLTDFPVTIPIEVHWGEMDAFNHVNNVHFYRYFESARIAYFAAMGTMAISADSGVGPILAASSCKYIAPVFYPDHLKAGAMVKEIADTRFSMAYGLWSTAQKRIVALGDALMVAYDYGAKKSAAVPETWRESIARIQG